MLKLQSSSKKTKCLWQVGQIAGFEWKWRRITVHSPCSLSPWLAAARGGSSNHRYKTTSNEHPPSTIVQQSQDKLWEKLKIWRHHEWRMHGKPAMDEYQRRWVGWRTGHLAAYTMHRIVPDNFLCVFSNMCCLFVVMQKASSQIWKNKKIRRSRMKVETSSSKGPAEDEMATRMKFVRLCPFQFSLFLQICFDLLFCNIYW